MPSTAVVKKRNDLRSWLDVLSAMLKEATDDVPIVKQILGAAVHIIEYAEKVDKKKEIMYALADKSATVAQQITTAVAGRAVDDFQSAHLERLKEIFTSVEEFMINVTSGGRMRRVLKHLFVMAKKVENLIGQLEDAIKAFLFVAALERENEQYVGEFHLVQQSDILNVGGVFHEARRYRGVPGVLKYIRAWVADELMVVRYPEADSHGKRRFRTSMLQHETLLQKISTPEMSHPNIAQLYGFGKGGLATRFTVVRSGHRPVSDLLDSVQGEETIAKTSSIIWKVLDAMSHLELKCGVAWQPAVGDSILLNDHGEPTIGLADDLAESSKYLWWPQFTVLRWQTENVESQRHSPCCLLDEIRGFRSPPNEQDRRFLQLWTMVAHVPISTESIGTHSTMSTTSLAQIPARTLLRVQEYMTDLYKKHADPLKINSFIDDEGMFITFLRMLATGNQNDLLEVVYSIAGFELRCDRITCYRITNFGDTGLLRVYNFDVPERLKLQARSVLGIFPPLAGEQRVFYAEFPRSPAARSCTQSSHLPQPSV